MKNKLSFISIFTLCIALSLTACGVKQASTTDSKNTQTEAGSEASGKSDSKLDDLYQQENQLFADHADVWNKVFGMMNKSDADPNGNYADYLAGTVESNKNSFTDDELKTLNEDIETIRKIEEQIAELENKNTSSDDNKKDSSKASSVFSDFSGEDFDGNKVDDSLFSGNAVTVVNFWFTGCKPCVAELSKLNELNDAINKILSNENLLKLNNGMFYHFCNLFLYSLGVNLYFSLKTRLKVLRLPKPLSIEISVRVSSVVSIL